MKDIVGRIMRVKPILLFLVLFPVSAFAQVMITGTIADENKVPLPGVNIVVKGTVVGTITSIDGSYNITALPGDTLLYSMIGMTSREVAVGDQTRIDVILSTEELSIEEVVVVGYGSQRVKDLTAPVVTIKGEDLSRQATSGALQALQGKAAGVQITGSGIPGKGPSIKIRGIGSIGDYANPLFIVDGVFVENLDFVSSSDIEDITVLKDASAAAIYGVRAANGVVLVTTKRGKSGKPSIMYDGYYGMQIPVDIMKMAGKDQYIQAYNDANANATGFIPRNASDYPVSTDWYKELVRNAPMTNHSINISGANEKTNYSFGGSFLNQEGIMDAVNSFQRFNIRVRLDQEVTDYLKIGMNILNSRHNVYNPNASAFFSAYVNPPVYPVYDPDNADAYPVKFGTSQKYGFGNQYGNPIATAYYHDSFNKGNNIVFSAYTEFYIIKDKLTFKTSFNQDMINIQERNYTPSFLVGGSQGVRKSGLLKFAGDRTKHIIDNILTYTGSSNDHTYTLLLGQSTRIERAEYLSGSAQDVPDIDEQSKYLVTGSSKDRNSDDGGYRYHGISFFTRANYNYASKYLATLTFRADGSSKFQKKWGYFPSIGLGWNISEEDFMTGDLFSYLKVRASWGLLGNDNVPSNSTLVVGQTGVGSSAVFGDILVNGVGAQTVLQNFLEWESVSEFNFGTDFTFRNARLSGELDLYRRVTNNVVFFAPIATGGGLRDLLANNGKVMNEGVELLLTWKDEFSENIDYNLSLNATALHNEVLKLKGRKYIPGGSVRGNFTTRTAVDHPIGSFYGYEIDGVYKTESEALLDDLQQTIKNKGFFRYKDQNGDNIINENDKVFLGNGFPWLTIGLDYGMNFKRLDIGVSLYGQTGNKILNAKRMNRDIFVDSNYDLDFYENRWTEDNKSDKYPSAEAYNYSFTQQANDFFVEDGSFVRIQNIQAGYTLRSKFFQSIRIYVLAQRPFTFFSYNGFTPEIGGIPIEAGIDNSIYPMQAIYTAGLKVNF